MRVIFISLLLEGYARHFAMLHLAIRGLTGGLDDGELEIMEYHASEQPNNALYQAIYHKFLDGDQSKAEKLLLSQDKFPDNNLPKDPNYCTDYLYQRDEASTHDWEPCPGHNHIYPGIDFLIAARFAL